MRLAGADARQDERRLAGVGRRRHPGIDAEILRLHHARPVERRRDALHALAGRRKERRGHQQHDQRAHRDRIEHRQARPRRAGLQRIGGAQRLLDMGAPQRARHLILLAGGELVGERGRRPVRQPAAAVEPAQAVEGAGQAEAEQRHRRDRDQHDPERTARSPAPSAADRATGRPTRRRGKSRWRRRAKPAPATAAPRGSSTMPAASARASSESATGAPVCWRGSASGSVGRSFTRFSGQPAIA